MELTERDRRLLNDLALHRVMTRDQLIALGYFPCVKRANRRLLTLLEAGLLERVRLNHCLLPKQAVYRASHAAQSILDPRVAAVLRARGISALQLDHALSVVDARIKLLSLGAERWLAEPQCRHLFEFGGKAIEVRPDGVAMYPGRVLLVEVDRGTVALPRMKGKLSGFAAYRRSGALARAYGEARPALLFVTAGSLRAGHLKGLEPKGFPMHLFVTTDESFRVATELGEVAR